MSRQFKITLIVLFVGAAVLGTIFAQKVGNQGKRPALLPLAVTIYDVDPMTNQVCMWRSDGSGEYINGVDSVTATIDTQYGELDFSVPSSSPRRVLIQFNELGKETCPNTCKDSKGNAALPPVLGTVNAISFHTYSRTGWSCENTWHIDCTQDFLHLIPTSTGHTNFQVPFYTPASKSSFYMMDYSRACPDYKVIGHVFYKAGQDLTGDGWADEWDLYPVPETEPVFAGDFAHIYLKMPGGKFCSYGRYEVPFRIHLRKI